MYGKEYLEKKEIKEATDAVEDAITEALEPFPSKVRGAVKREMERRASSAALGAQFDQNAMLRNMRDASAHQAGRPLSAASFLGSVLNG